MNRSQSGIYRDTIRRNTIRRDHLPAIIVLAVASAVLATFSGCHPTEQPIIDAILTAALAGATVYFSASASWWALVIAGGLAASTSGTWWGTGLALSAVAGGLWLGSERRSVPPLRCACAAAIVQVLLRLHLTLFFGASATIAGGAFVLLLGISIQRRRPTTRRRIVRVVLGGMGIALLAAIGFGVALARAGDNVQHGYEGLLDGLDQLQTGDLFLASQTLRQAGAELRAGGKQVDSIWSQPARLLPVVAQHRNAIDSIVNRAASAADAAADALDLIDLHALTIDHGRIDVAAIAALAEPLTALRDAVEEVNTALREADSPWLIGPVGDRLDRYRRRAEQTVVQARATAAAATFGPDMLGADGPRRYLIAFCSPAEARGSGGVMGNYAVITVDNGAISLTEFGRGNTLSNEVRDDDPVPLVVSDEYRAQYGRDELDQDGNASPALISNWAMSPDLPTGAKLLADVWSGVGHTPVDGVFVIDPSGLAALLKATGPVSVTGLDQPLSSSNVEQFLLLDQYALDTPARSDLLEAVSNAVVQAMLGGSLPDPQVLAAQLGEAATTGHIAGWIARPQEQELMKLIGMDGGFPELDGRDGFAVVTNNATANKIDTFLQRTIRYEAEVHDRYVQATLTVTLHNTAPASGYPDYVIGTEFFDLPSGTNRTLLTLYSPLSRTDATLDGEPVGLSQATELGWYAYTLLIDLAPGQTRVVELHLAGQLAADDYALIVRPQPLAKADQVSIEVGGDSVVHFAGTVSRRTVIDARGATALR